MANINEIISAANKASRTANMFDAVSLVRAADKLREKGSTAEADALEKIANKFDRFDSNKDGKISSDELKVLAASKGEPDDLSDAEIRSKLQPPPPAGVGRSSSSPAPSGTASPSSTSTTASTGDKLVTVSTPDQFHNYAINGYKESYKILKDESFKPKSNSVDQTIEFDAIKLGGNLVAKMFIGIDDKVHIMIFPEGNYSEENLVQEFTVPVEALESTCASNGYFLKIPDRDNYWNAGRLNTKKLPVLELDDSQKQSKETVAKIILKTFLKNGGTDEFRNLSDVKFRQSRGMGNLMATQFGNVPALEAKATSFDSLYSDIGNKDTGYLKLVNDNQAKIEKETKKWFYLNGNSGPVGKLCLTKDNGGFYRYRLITAFQRDGKQHIQEFIIQPTSLQKIANRDCVNVFCGSSSFSANQVDIDAVRDFLVGHFKKDNDSVTAYKNKNQGFAQFGEIEGIRFRAAEGATLTDAATAMANLFSDKPSDKFNYGYGTETDKWKTDLGYKDGSMPALSTVNDDKIGPQVATARFFPDVAFLPNPTTEYRAGWKTKMVITKENTSIFFWNKEENLFEQYIIPTNRVLDYVNRESSGKKYNDAVFSVLKQDTNANLNLFREFRTLYSNLLKDRGWESVIGSDYFYRKGTSIDDLYSKAPERKI